MSNKYNVAGDPGHGGKDPGASKGNIIEAHQVLKLTTDWMREVERRTQEEIMIYRTRTKDEWKSLQARTDWINSWRKNGKKFDICVSVHRDSFTNKAARGITIYVQRGCYKGNTKRLADIFDKHLDKLGFQDRNIKEQNFHMTRETVMPAILIEVGFISSDEDNKKFEKDYNKIVKAMADATLEYFNVKDKVQSSSKPQTPPTSTNTNIKVGDRVKITGSKYATGQNISDWAKKQVHTISKIDKDRALLKEITSWCYLKDLQISTSSKKLQVGMYVQMLGKTWATRQTVPSWVKNNKYKVKQISGDRALLDSVISWAYIKDLKY